MTNKLLLMTLLICFSTSSHLFAKDENLKKDSPKKEVVEKKAPKAEKIELEAYIIDEPRFHESDDGKYQSYSYKVSPVKDRKYGDEYMLVSHKTVSWGEKVGEFKYKKGDKVKLSGKFKPRKDGKAKGGLMGSLDVNHFTHEQVFKEKRTPAKFKFKKVK